MTVNRFEKMGKKKKKGGVFSSCFGSGSDEQPEIRFDPDSDKNIQSVVLDTPMPNEVELEEKFAELVDELDLTGDHRKAMFELSAEKKWQIYCSRSKKVQNINSTCHPEYYIDRVNTFNNMYYQKTDDEISERTKFFEELKTALRTQPMSFVQQFLNSDGLQSLIEVLANMDWETCQSTIHTACIGCIKALMNNSNGRSEVLAHPKCIDIITQSLVTENLKTKTAVLEILGACCLVPGGHKKVLDAMCHFQVYAEERTRFQTIVNDLDRSTGSYRDEFSSKIAIMSFINAALRYGAGVDHLEFRIHLRFEFLMLGIQPVMDKLRNKGNLTLDRHLDFFNMIRARDEEELAKRYGVPQIDSKSASSVLDVLKQKIGHTTCYVHLLSILQHFLLLPTDHKKGALEYWRIIDRIIQEITLQQNDGTDLDQAPVDIYVRHIVDKMTTDDFKDDTVSKLAKRETEMVELRNTIEKMADKLEKETKCKEDLQKKISDKELKNEKLQEELNSEMISRLKLEKTLKEIGSTSSISDDAKIATLASLGIKPIPPPPLDNSPALPPPPSGFGVPLPPIVPALAPVIGSSGGTISHSIITSLPPPPPPLLGGAPPPPPPMMVGGMPPPPPPLGMSIMPPPPPMGGLGFLKKKSNLPKPSQPLKSFNWSKIPDTKLKGTIWTEMDEAEVIPFLEFGEIDEMFSAYQKKENKDEADGMVAQVKDTNNTNKPKELAFIDNNRSRNCEIILKKMGMENDEIAEAILDMDQDDKLSKDMVEQMLKITPTQEETNLLSTHVTDIDLFAVADRYLFEMSKIPHFEQRLKALFYKKGFNERVGELKPKIECLIRACKQLSRSKRLKTLLEVILCLGNYMNRGSRGNASGFKLSSMNKIVDTKSSIDRRITLLHYVLELLSKKFPLIFKLEDELPDIRDASKINPVELGQELNYLRKGINQLEDELSYQNSLNNKDPIPNDRFIEVIGNFTKICKFSIQEIEELAEEMKDKIEKTIALFGDDNKTMTSDEFFGIFNQFLVSFAEAKDENISMKKQKEDEERKARSVAEQKEKERQRMLSKKMNSDTTTDEKRKSLSERSPGEFDDLISALRTGDVFGDELTYKGRKRQSKARNVANVTAPNKMSIIRDRDRVIDKKAIAKMV